MDDDRIEGAAKNIGGKAQAAVGDLVGDQKTQTEGVINQIAGSAQNAFGSVKDTAKQLADNAPRSLDDAVDTGQRYVRQGSQMVQERIGNVPLTEILLAAATGYFLAWLIHSRD